MRTERHYLSVGDRRVHYRRAGAGPPLVMMHGSPGDSAMLHEEMKACAGEFTCIALDTPGFGESDPLPGDALTVRDLAEATAAAMAALELPPCRVYGTHTGAAIGVELGLGWPERVSGLVLEGLPIFTEAEIQMLFGGQAWTMIPDPLGGHLTQTWMRFRDQFSWFPWWSRELACLNPINRPGPAAVDEWVSMFYRSCRTYTSAYKAISRYGHGAFCAAEATRTPTVYMASAEDMLFSHLERLPSLSEGQRIERLAYDPAAKYTAIRTFSSGLPGGREPSPAPRSRLAGADPSKGFVNTAHGQVFVRAYGAGERAALILLHDAPGTGLALDGLARRLAKDAFVVVPDLPGCGASTAADGDAAILETCADAVQAIVDTLGLERPMLGAIGCGCAVAAMLASRREDRFGDIVMENSLYPDSAAQALIAPDLSLSAEGAHWVKAWLMVRDGQIYAPWYDGRVSAQRSTQGVFDADWLHDQTVALMHSRTTYHQFARAAVAYDACGALNQSPRLVHFAAKDGLEAMIRSLCLEESNQ